MIKIAVYSLKGGVGKTMTAATLGQLYATRYSRRMLGINRKSHRKTLLVDCDPQGNLSQYFKRYDAAASVGYEYVGRRPLGTDWPYLEIITGNMQLYDAERNLYADKNTSMLQHLLNGIDAQGQYDICIMDCAPAMNMITINALCAADYLIVPIRLDAFSANGLVELSRQLKDVMSVNMRLTMLGVLITHDEPSNLSEEAENLLRQQFPVFNTKISKSRWIVDSTLMQQPLSVMGMRLKPSYQYRKLLKEVIVRIGHMKGEKI